MSCSGKCGAGNDAKLLMLWQVWVSAWRDTDKNSSSADMWKACWPRNHISLNVGLDVAGFDQTVLATPPEANGALAAPGSIASRRPPGDVALQQEALLFVSMACSLANCVRHLMDPVTSVGNLLPNRSTIARSQYSCGMAPSVAVSTTAVSRGRRAARVLASASSDSSLP